MPAITRGAPGRPLNSLLTNGKDGIDASHRSLRYSEEALQVSSDLVIILAMRSKLPSAPEGRNVVLDKSFGPPQVCNGVTIAKEADSFENMGAQFSRKPPPRLTTPPWTVTTSHAGAGHQTTSRSPPAPTPWPFRGLPCSPVQLQEKPQSVETREVRIGRLPASGRMRKPSEDASPKPWRRYGKAAGSSIEESKGLSGTDRIRGRDAGRRGHLSLVSPTSDRMESDILDPTYPHRSRRFPL